MSPRLKTCDYTPQGHHSRRTWARGATYAYDHRGRMVSKEILPTSTNSTFSTLHSTFVWDGWNIIRETTSNLSTFQPFNLSTSYVWGLDIDGTLQGAGGVGGLLAAIQTDCTATNSPTPNSTTYQLYLPSYDANGNITEYVSTNGDIVAHYEYSAFGEPTVSSGELASAFTHQFSTKPYCHVTGFNEYVYRKYRPAIGRWMSRDPIAEFASLPVYAYARPVMAYDYLGLKCCDNIGEKRNCSVELTTVRTLGDPNLDSSYENYLKSFSDLGDLEITIQAAKFAAGFLSGGTTAALGALTDYLLNETTLSPNDVAQIGENLLNHYQKRGKETQGVSIWTRVCCDECKRNPFYKLSRSSWERVCRRWQKYKYKVGYGETDFFASESDASKHFGNAIKQANAVF